ncbi:hypothetical protein ABZT06_16750 [Streptomyces sp. NPDC005483]|uniref:hypothetical protein n=1 Tax=Streptomyces sp. NPDC005483 TaxID=3154882 RepID=UPI0033A3DD65
MPQVPDVADFVVVCSAATMRRASDLTGVRLAPVSSLPPRRPGDRSHREDGCSA